MEGGLTPVLGGGIALALSALLTPPAARFLLEKGIAAANYRGEALAPAGLALAASVVAAAAAVTVLEPGLGDGLLPAVAVLSLAGWGGFLDDVAGGGDPKGLRGHLAALRAGRLTAGTLKGLALLGSGALAGAAAAGAGPAAAGAAAALVPLAAHAVNCLDLRPGRAGKAFLLGLAAVGAAGLALRQPLPAFAALLAGAAAGFLPWDLRRRALLGDTGANLLGAGLGLAAARTLPLPGQALAVGFLLVLLAVAERTSLSRVIEGNRVLRRVDAWGRRQPG